VAPVATAEQATLDAELDAPPLFEHRSLEDVVLKAWEELRLSGHTACLVCGSEVTTTADCPRCGSELG
jgi:hypothetical protein